MSVKSVFARLSAHFAELAKEDEAKEVEKVELATMTLKDGTEVEAEVFEPGANIFIVNPEGDNIPAPVGEHLTQEGKIIVVTEEGVIAEVKDAEVSETEETTEVVEEEMANEEDKYALMAEEINKIKEELATIKEAMGKKEEMEKQVKEEEEAKKAELAAQEPAAKPIKAAPKEDTQKLNYKFGQKGEATTKDRVFSRLFNN